MYFLSIEFRETGYAVIASAPDASLYGAPMPPFPGTPESSDASWPVS